MKLTTLFTIAAACALAQPPFFSSIKPDSVRADIPANRGAAAVWQSLKKLQTRASLIMITAHPDDEDGGMLTFESRGQGARVALLTLNRGEGGANVMSPDYFDALGLVRTMELLEAGRYYGVDQYWTRVIDYGFSKTMDESIQHWTRDRVLYDVVRVVRMVRPLVVTSVFVGGPTDGHGNHQTAGAMAQAVFKVAGDPNVFPDQIKAGLRPWQPLKDYARTPWFGRGEKNYSVNVEIPQGNYDPMLGVSYVQLSREGLGYQKSQNGGGSIPNAGALTSTYHRFGSMIPARDKEESFFDGIDISLPSIATLAKGGDSAFLTTGLRKINAAVENAISAFSPSNPERTAPALATGLKATIALLEEVERSNLSDESKYDIRHELQIKRAQFNNALAEALGLSIAAAVTPEKEPDARMAMFLGDPQTYRLAIPGQTVYAKVHVVNSGPTPVKLDEVYTAWSESNHERAPDAEIAKPKYRLAGANGHAIDLRFAIKIPDNAKYTRPYFSRPDIEQSYYDISDTQYLNLPLAPYPLAAWAEFTYEGAPVSIAQYVQTNQRETGLGSVHQPLAIAPAVSVQISPRAGIVPLQSRSFPVTAVVHSNVKGPANGAVRLDVPAGWKCEPPSHQFSTVQDGEDQSVTFTVTPANLSEKPYQITAVADYSGRQYREGYTLTGYPGLRPYFLYKPSTYKTTGVDVKVAPGLKVGYVMGSGDDVPASLEHLGIKVTFLTPQDIASGDLSKYDVILFGVRTYAARPELATYNNRILDYVKNGGVLIVQYNTPEYDRNYGPYPYVMSNNPEEVTDEASKVAILEPANAIFSWPNKIGDKDFEGWVEERGSKWMKSWDPRYQALLETHDEGQAPQKGGLLYARYGKGIYVYNAYAFYRELPEGVPGAYRIMANMISLPKNPGK